MRGLRAALALCAVCALPACGRVEAIVRWERQLETAQRDVIEGRPAQARAAFEALEATAPRAEDADQARLEVCNATWRTSDLPATLACYERAEVRNQLRENKARALLHQAEVLFDMPGRRVDGLRRCLALIDGAPDTAPALRALDYILVQARRTEADRLAALRLLDARWVALRDGALGDNLLLVSAELLTRGGSPAELEEADRRLGFIETHYGGDTLILEAIWARVGIYRRLGRVEAERLALERLIATRESSFIFATYDHSRYREGLVRLVEILRDVRGDYDRALLYCEWLLTKFKKPLKKYEYYYLRGTVYEKAGDVAAARAAYQEVIDHDRAERAADMRNDRRICDESESDAQRQACHADLAGRPVFESPAVARARKAIESIDTRARARTEAR